MSTATGTTHTAPARRAEILRLPRTTGALSGLLVLLLGVWGGLIPFVGPYFHYAFGGYQHWHFTNQRLWLDIVPGAVAVVGGLMLMRASTRIGGLTAGWVAVAAGAWFAVGPTVSILWHHSFYAIGAPMGGDTRQMLEWLGYFYGIGVLIVGLAAFAMGRYFSRPRIVTEAAALAEAPVAERDAVAADRAPVAAAPVAGRRVVADDRAPLAEDRAPLAEDRAPIADEPVADRGTVADEPATVADREPIADEPRATSDAPAGTAYPESTTAARGRQGGLLGRFRRP